MQPLPGFRDFLPDDCAQRDYITTQWRRSAKCYGFVEFDGPALESAELYEKKNSGGEILSQLYSFRDRGERSVVLRPEMTPTLARIIGSHHRSFLKPLRWFNIGHCYRYEKPQRGRLREFLQLNCDLLGESSPAADAEVIGLLIDIFKSVGLGPRDVVIRLSDRLVWQQFLQDHDLPDEKMREILHIVDKIEREPQSKTEEKLAACSSSLSVKMLQQFIKEAKAPSLAPLLQELSARGLRDYIQVDLSIVRGLAYYTGVVFEAFSLQGGLRALAGGGRYDHLIHHLSDGAANMPAVGFGMGDTVLLDFITSIPSAAEKKASYLAANAPCQIYLVIADETYREEAIMLASQLRREGWRVLFPLSTERVSKQFSNAQAARATLAIVIGAEWPLLKIKHLNTREEEEITPEHLFKKLAGELQSRQGTFP